MKKRELAATERRKLHKNKLLLTKTVRMLKGYHLGKLKKYLRARFPFLQLLSQTTLTTLTKRDFAIGASPPRRCTETALLWVPLVHIYQGTAAICVGCSRCRRLSLGNLCEVSYLIHNAEMDLKQLQNNREVVAYLQTRPSCDMANSVRLLPARFSVPISLNALDFFKGDTDATEPLFPDADGRFPTPSVRVRDSA